MPENGLSPRGETPEPDFAPYQSADVDFSFDPPASDFLTLADQIDPFSLTAKHAFVVQTSARIRWLACTSSCGLIARLRFLSLSRRRKSGSAYESRLNAE